MPKNIASLTEEDLTLTRDQIQAFIDGSDDPPGKPGRTRRGKNPAKLRAELKGKGYSDDVADKVIGDLDSYL